MTGRKHRKPYQIDVWVDCFGALLLIACLVMFYIWVSNA